MYLKQELTHKIIAAAIEVHKNLGPGLLENVYLLCLGIEFASHGLRYQKEVDIPLTYKGQEIERHFRIDFLVEDTVVIELKSIDAILPVHERIACRNPTPLG